MNMANSQLREHSRWLKDYKANPEKYGSATVNDSSASQDQSLSQLQQLLASNGAMAGANTTSTMLQMMMMLMMYQMMGQVFPGMASGMPLGGGLNVPTQAQSVQDPFQAFPQYQLPGSQASSQSATQKAVDTLLSHLLKDPESDTGQETINTPDVSSLMSDWETAGLNEVQFGQTIMYLLHQGDQETLSALSQWLPELLGQGSLMPLPLLQGDYLSRLDQSRKDILAQAIADAGLSNNDNAPNSVLISNLIGKASTPPTSDASLVEQEMAQSVIRALVANASDEALTSDGQEDLYLPNLLYLSGFERDENGQWLGPFALERPNDASGANV